MRSKSLVLVSALVLTPTLLLASPKTSKKHHQPTVTRTALKSTSTSTRTSVPRLALQTSAEKTLAARRMQMMREESLPGRLKNGGEPSGGPVSYEMEKLANRAYPGKDIPLSFMQTAKQNFAKVRAESAAGIRGPRIATGWTSLGPTIALYPAVLGRTGAAYITSGRISALAIENSCTTVRCRLYVGAAGGGVWRTDKALSTAPIWTNISDSFATNAIGAITIDPTDASGNTIYVGTGEPNASADSGAGQGIYKSTDGGDSWSLLAGSAFAVNRSISNVVIDPSNASTIYAGTTRGIRGYSAVTGGATGNPPPPTGQPVGLYKSIDGGATFNLVFSPGDITGFSEGVPEVALDPTNPHVVYASAFGLGIFRSAPYDHAGAYQQVFVSLGFVPTQGDFFARTAFALTYKGGHSRMYVGDGGGNGGPPGQPGAGVWRNDNMNQLASALVVADANGPSWKSLSSSNVADPGYATYNYCTGQCWYDNAIFTPKGQPDTVVVIGSFVYGEAGSLSNARGVLRSTTAGDPDPKNNNRTFTDLTFDATSASAPNSIHPDQHALVFKPGNANIWFEGSDGGLVRSSGVYADISGQCASRGLSADGTLTCERLLSSVPTKIFSLNTGLNTLQFQSLSINPSNPTGELLGGTQDNGTWRYQGTKKWLMTMGGDGGQSGFNALAPSTRFHTYYAPQVDINFHGQNPLGWDWISDRFFAAPAEGWAFYIPIIADPNPAKAGSMFAGLQGVWRTRDNGGQQPSLDLHCNEFFGDFTITCGDWVELGSATGLSDPNGDLTSATYGADKAGGTIANIARATSDKNTLWAATSTGRVFVTKNADAVSHVAGADGSSVVMKRIDSLSAAAPARFVSGIAVDPANPNHAWISYSGYTARTPTTPGHVFDVTYDPVAGAATWSSIDDNLGDIPVAALVRDDATGDLYSSNDFGVLRLASGSSTWNTAATGLPNVEVPGLVLSNSARVLYAATHGRGAYALNLPAAPTAVAQK
jgi:hypothetical protein